MQMRHWVKRCACAPRVGILLVLGWHAVASGQIPETARKQPGRDQYVWGALVRATNQEIVQPAKVLDMGLLERLGGTFSFRHFQLLGEHTQPVSPEYETWVLPSEELYLKVDSKGPHEGGLGLHLQLWRRQNVVLKTDVILSAGSPIVIAGPKWGEDQLLLVVQLQEGP